MSLLSFCIYFEKYSSFIKDAGIFKIFVDIDDAIDVEGNIRIGFYLMCEKCWDVNSSFIYLKIM